MVVRFSHRGHRACPHPAILWLMMQSEPEQLHKVPSRSNSDGDSKRGLLRRAPTFRAPERMLTQNSYTVFQERVVIAMVGLPARGKSYISKAIVRYLNFLGCPTQLFNAGSLRRKQGLAGTDASFFDPSNKSAQEQGSTVRTCVTGHVVFSQVLVCNRRLKRSRWRWTASTSCLTGSRSKQ